MRGLKNGDLPKVTIIIPSYNREKFICETINSALSQTYPNIEVIAVDDGSTDTTGEVLLNYGDKITVLEHSGRANKGQSAAINLAMRETRSKYVAILDSDDLWVPDKIEQQVKFLEKHPDVGLVYANGYAIDENGNKLYKLIPLGHVENNDPSRLLLQCHFSVPSNSLVRRSVFETVGDFDETMRSAQDHDMAVRIAEVTKLSYIDQPLWYYRRHPDTQSGKHVRRRWETGFRILNKACERYNYGFTIRRKRLSVLHFRVGQCILEERNYFKAILRFTFAGALDPLRAIKILFGKERLTGHH